MATEAGIRLNKYLALAGIASRREADRLIAAGRVTINGKKAALGTKVLPNDKVEVDEAVLAKQTASRFYLAYNKPAGILTNPDGEAKSIRATLGAKISGTFFPIGRLDKESRGLIILTNDGRLTEPLLSPEFNHEKEYRVTVDKSLTPMFQKAITTGLKLEDFTAKPCTLEKISPTEFFLTLTEGKKHQIRRMCATLGYQVQDLCRVRIMNIELEDLTEGKFRKIEGDELAELLSSLNLPL